MSANYRCGCILKLGSLDWIIQCNEHVGKVIKLSNWLGILTEEELRE